MVSEAAKRRRLVEEPGQPQKRHTVASEAAGVLQALASSLGRAQVDDDHEAGLLPQLIGLQLAAKDTRAASLLNDVLAEAREELQVTVEALQAALDKCASSGRLAEPPAVAADSQGVRELISYAHRLSFTTRAPPGFVPGASQLGQFQPPAPQDLQFRASLLHEFGRQHAERQRAASQAAAAAAPPKPAAATAMEPKAAMPAAEALASAAAFPQLSPEEAEAILASMPAGWKPGDGILLPGKPAAAAAAGVAELAVPEAEPATAAAKAERSPVQQQQVSAVSEEEREEAAVQQPPPLFSFALNQDLEYLADLTEEDFAGSSVDDAESSSSSSEDDE